MSAHKKLATAALAGLLTTSFMSATIAHAQTDATKTPTSDVLEKHACKGQNSCKGKGADGKNECKGKGSCATDGSKQ
jgi:hypothetical protein